MLPAGTRHLQEKQFEPHRCLSDEHCAAEGHDRTCAVPGCTNEIEDDKAVTCDQHRYERRYYDPEYDPHDHDE